MCVAPVWRGGMERALPSLQSDPLEVVRVSIDALAAASQERITAVELNAKEPSPGQTGCRLRLTCLPSLRPWHQICAGAGHCHSSPASLPTPPRSPRVCSSGPPNGFVAHQMLHRLVNYAIRSAYPTEQDLSLAVAASPDLAEMPGDHRLQQAHLGSHRRSQPLARGPGELRCERPGVERVAF